MKKLNRKNKNLENKLPIKIVQFGEGNFLRAFVDDAFQKLNKEVNFNAGIAVVQPIEHGMIEMLNKQDGLYTLFLNGLKNGEEIQTKELITNIVKGVDPYKNFDEYLELAKEENLEFIISNTTEAGISYDAQDKPAMQPPNSFPAKLTVLLYERFKFFKGDSKKGLTIIPCELINYNADNLKEIILKYIEIWNLEPDFKNWIIEHNTFHNTLVDRIVPGYPKAQIEKYNAQLDYQDDLIVTAEPFFLWVIEGSDALKEKLPFEQTNLDVKIVEDIQPFRTRKVRILNGAHTAMVPFSILYGNTTVRETIENDFTGKFVENAVYDEIIKTLDLSESELKHFADEVFDRFRNPFVEHQLSSIALNSISKFKVRVLPSLLKYVELNDKLPVHLVFAFASLIRFYKEDWNGTALPIQDDKEIVNTFKEIWDLKEYEQIAKVVLGNQEFWGQDLNLINSLTKAITLGLEEIDQNGIEQGFINFKNKF
ncbi:MAG: tagaturonate reductase [Flavobacteriaceae bacterium]|nr:tagaturonate reductase [Flavobacteriaceae bacterium]